MAAIPGVDAIAATAANRGSRHVAWHAGNVVPKIARAREEVRVPFQRNDRRGGWFDGVRKSKVVEILQAAQIHVAIKEMVRRKEVLKRAAPRVGRVLVT